MQESLSRKILADEVDLSKQRWVARDTPDIFSSIFTWWNLLDSVMLSRLAGNYATGYVRELQLRRMVQLVREPHVGRYCEIGMNGGHSVVAMLEANPNVTCDVFDLMMWNYSEPIAALLTARYGHRFRLHRGSSWKLVPLLARSGELAQKCDLIFIDGDHTPMGSRADMLHSRAIAARSARIILDDIAISTQTRPGPIVALRQMEVAGLMRSLEVFGTFPPGHYYNPCMRVPPQAPGRKLPPRSNFCVPWGFAVCAYVEAQQFNLSWTERSVARAANLSPETLLAIHDRDANGN